MNHEDEFLISTQLPLGISTEDLSTKTNLRPWDLGPALQGIIMECVSPQTAEALHNSTFNPYSQYCIVKDGELCWTINTLTNEAYNAITLPVMSSSNLKIKKLDLPFECGQPKQKRVSRKELTSIIHESPETKFSFEFATPASFKSKGGYQNIPSMRLIYQNLLLRYTQVFEGSPDADAETIEYLDSHTRITRYSLSSKPFHLGHGKIPSFTGIMNVEIRGNQTLSGFAHMLFEFGNYGGVGIKTSMGMGGFSTK